MKKRILLLCLVLMLALSALSAYAAPARYVTDDAGILSSRELERLEDRARELTERYNFGVYIVIVQNYRDYGTSSYNAACSIYSDMGCGLRDSQDGEMLFMSMSGRDFSLITHGYYGNEAFNDYAQEKVENAFLDDFRDNDWYSGFNNYLNACERCLAAAEKGTPLSERIDPSYIAGKVGISLLIGVGVAFIICMGMKAGMKSVHKGTSAAAYVVGRGINLRMADDHFTHTTTVRHPISSSSSSSGGHSSHSSGGGFSGRSGKF